MIASIIRAFRRKPHIEVSHSKPGTIVPRPAQSWVRIVAPNGEPMATTETYGNPSNARRAAKVWQEYTGWEVREV